MKKIILGLIPFVVFAAHADTKVLTPEKMVRQIKSIANLKRLS